MSQGVPFSKMGNHILSLSQVAKKMEEYLSQVDQVTTQVPSQYESFFFPRALRPEGILGKAPVTTLPMILGKFPAPSRVQSPYTCIVSTMHRCMHSISKPFLPLEHHDPPTPGSPPMRTTLPRPGQPFNRKKAGNNRPGKLLRRRLT